MCRKNNECRVVAIANQKGGVTKTTSTCNLGIGLARLGYKVLVVDSDAQGSLTASESRTSWKLRWLQCLGTLSMTKKWKMDTESCTMRKE